MAIVWSSQRHFLHLCIQNMYTQHMYNRALYTYINIRTYMHPHWKPLHPLCSRSGHRPGANLANKATGYQELQYRYTNLHYPCCVTSYCVCRRAHLVLCCNLIFLYITNIIPVISRFVYLHNVTLTTWEGGPGQGKQESDKAAGYMVQGLIPGRGKILFLQYVPTGSGNTPPPTRPPAAPVSLLLVNWYWKCFPQEQSSCGMRLTTHLHLVPRLRMCVAIPHGMHRDNFTISKVPFQNLRLHSNSKIQFCSSVTVRG
jgi:hypothetical protein